MSTSPDPASPAVDERRWRSHRRYLYLLAKLAFVGVVAAFAWQVMVVLSGVLMPAMIGLALAYVCDPLIDAFERRRVPRGLAIAGLAVVILALLGVLVVIVLPAFAMQFADTVQKLPGWIDMLYQGVATFARDRFGYSGAEVEAATRKMLLAAQGAVLGLIRGLGTSLNAAVTAALTPIFFFYFLSDFDRIKVKPLALVPPRYHDYVLSRARTIDQVVGGWMRGQVQVVTVLSLLYAVGLTIVGIKLGFAIGIVAGLLGFVPYVGAVTGIVLSVLMALIEHGGWNTFVGVAVVFGVALTLDAYFITPRLVGSKVGMNPLLVIVAVLVGGSLFGIVGMMIAVPVTAAAGVLLADAVAAYKKSDFFTAGAPAAADVTRLEPPDSRGATG